MWWAHWGAFFFVGLRGADTTLSVAGALILVLSVAVDMATSSVMTRNQSHVRLELTFKTSPQRICASVDTGGAALWMRFWQTCRGVSELLDGWNAVAAAAIGSTVDSQETPTTNEPIF